MYNSKSKYQNGGNNDLDKINPENIINQLQSFQINFINASIYDSEEITSRLKNIKENFLSWNIKLKQLDSNLAGELWTRYIIVLKNILILTESIAYTREKDRPSIHSEQEEYINKSVKKLAKSLSIMNDRLLIILNTIKNKNEKIKDIKDYAYNELDSIQKDINILIDKMPDKYFDQTSFGKITLYIFYYFNWVLYVGLFLHYNNYLDIISKYKDLEWYDILFRVISGMIITNFRNNPITHFRVAEATKNVIKNFLKLIPLLNILVNIGENNYLIGNFWSYFYYTMWPLIYDFFMFGIRLIIYSRSVIMSNTVQEYILQIYDRYIANISFAFDFTPLQNYILNLIDFRINETKKHIFSYVNPKVYWNWYCTNKRNDSSLYNKFKMSLCGNDQETSSYVQTVINFTGQDVVKIAEKTIENIQISIQQQNVLTLECGSDCQNKWTSFENILQKQMDDLGFMDIYQETYKSSPWVQYRTQVTPQNTDVLISGFFLYNLVFFIILMFYKTEKPIYKHKRILKKRKRSS
jgi:hypothetical protein